MVGVVLPKFCVTFIAGIRGSRFKAQKAPLDIQKMAFERPQIKKVVVEFHHFFKLPSSRVIGKRSATFVISTNTDIDCF